MRVESAAERLFFSTVRINTTSPDSSARMGTGFFFEHLVNGRPHQFVVTSKRTVVGKYGGHLSLLQGKDGQPELGSVFRYAIGDWHDGWFLHPRQDTDVAVLHFDPINERIREKYKVELFYTVLHADMIPDERQRDALDALESVVFIGYSDGTCDTKCWLPVARSAVTATPLSLDFENTPYFLIDAAIFPGSCGSPVFIINSGPFTTRADGRKQLSCPLFVGSLSTGHIRKQPDPVTSHDHMLWEQERTHLGHVVKSGKTVETIEEFVKVRGVG